MRKKIALIGCGRIGQRHAEQIDKYAELVAVCDIIPSRADELSLKYQCPPFYHLQDLLNATLEIDLISICTPNGLHAGQAMACLRSGRHVLCEKPLCIETTEGMEMMHVAKEHNRKLLVVKQNRYNPPVVLLKDLIDKGKLGKIFSFQINCFWNRPPEYYTDWKGTKELDGGTLFTQFSHFIDLLYWLLGDVDSVKSFLHNYAHPNIEFEDTGVVAFRLKSGIIGSLNYTVNSLQKNMEGSFTVFAEKGTIKIGGQYLNELAYFQVEGMEEPVIAKSNPANGYGFYQGSMSNHHLVYQHLIEALDDNNNNFASAAEGLKTVEIIKKIYTAN